MKISTFVYPYNKTDKQRKMDKSVLLIKGSCGLDSCNCSNGYYVVICLGKNKNNKVKTISLKFDNKREYTNFLNGTGIYEVVTLEGFEVDNS